MAQAISLHTLNKWVDHEFIYNLDLQLILGFISDFKTQLFALLILSLLAFTAFVKCEHLLQKSVVASHKKRIAILLFLLIVPLMRNDGVVGMFSRHVYFKWLQKKVLPNSSRVIMVITSNT